MLAIRIELLAERYHATPWGRAANEGDVEWPPSPWRLGRALVDAWYRLPPEQRPSEAEVDAALAALSAPPRFVLPPATVGHSRHYMPLATHGPTVQTRLVLDAFVRTAARPIVMVWPEDADAGIRATVATLLTAVGYLGRAESPCLAQLVVPPDAATTFTIPLSEAGEQDEGEIVRVLCLSESARVADLSISTGEVRRKRGQRPPAGRFVEYVRATDALEPPRRRAASPPRPSARVQVVRMALESPVLPPLTEALRVAELARSRLLSVADSSGADVIMRLRGRRDGGGALDGHQHCHYLVTDEDADGRADHLTIWCPAGLGDEERALIDRASPLESWWTLRPLHLVVMDPGPQPVRPGPLAAATRWVSHTPFLPPRHPKRRADGVRDSYPDQVRTELSRRGLPDPVEVIHRRPRQRHWGAFRRERGGREPTGAALGYELVFDRPVSGPIALGRNSHFGMGLFLPTM